MGILHFFYFCQLAEVIFRIEGKIKSGDSPLRVS